MCQAWDPGWVDNRRSFCQLAEEDPLLFYIWVGFSNIVFAERVK